MSRAPQGKNLKYAGLLIFLFINFAVAAVKTGPAVCALLFTGNIPLLPLGS